MKCLITKKISYFSDCPTNGDKISLTATEYNAALASYAKACTRCVFPVPGGPNKRTLLNTLRWTNNCGWFLGNKIIECNTLLISHKPAISLNPRTFGTSVMLLIRSVKAVVLEFLFGSVLPVDFLFWNVILLCGANVFFESTNFISSTMSCCNWKKSA